MARIKQCVCYPIFSEKIPVKELFPLLAKIGYQAVELWAPGDDLPEVAKLAGSCGLKVASIVGGGGIDRGLSDRATHAEFEGQLRQRLDLATRLGIGNMIVLAGQRLKGLSDLAAIGVVADELAKVASLAEQADVNLNLELLNSKVDHPGYVCDRTDWGLAVVQRVKSPRVKLLYDIYHMQIMEGDVIRTIRGCIQWIGHFHTAGNPGRNDFDDTQEMNYRGICSAIAASGYDGYVGHEFKPKGDLVAALKQAFDICDAG